MHIVRRIILHISTAQRLLHMQLQVSLGCLTRMLMNWLVCFCYDVFLQRKGNGVHACRQIQP